MQSAESEEADDEFDLALLEGEVLSSLQEMNLKSEEGMLSTDSAVYWKKEASEAGFVLLVVSSTLLVKISILVRGSSDSSVGRVSDWKAKWKTDMG